MSVSLGTAVSYPISSVAVLGQQHTAVSGAADTNENTLYSLTIPAGLMGPNDSLRVSFLVTTTNSANNKLIRVKFGGQVIAQQAVTTAAALKGETLISNRNAQNAQICAGATGGLSNLSGGSSGVVNSTFTIDTTQAQSLLVAGTKVSAGETLTLESVLVELIRGV